MERKIGEVFEFDGKSLKVVEVKEHDCAGCFFEDDCSKFINHILGDCSDRSDRKHVIFVEAEQEQEGQQEEKPQEKKEQGLNLLELLKNCPRGQTFYSPMFGDIKFIGVNYENKLRFTTMQDNLTWIFNMDGTCTFTTGQTTPECMLYPSKDKRTWEGFRIARKVSELPQTWSQFCLENPVVAECWISQNCYIVDERTGENRLCDDDRNLLPTKKAAEAHLALMQLHQLRDCWRDGWTPSEGENVWQIRQHWDNGDLNPVLYGSTTYSSFLSFQDEERAKKFAECFDLLIEKAGDLI